MLDGFTVSLPDAKAAAPARGSGSSATSIRACATRSSLNKSRDVIGATQLEAATGASGAGIKIGVVDDGDRPDEPVLQPDRLLVPARVPEGQDELHDAEGDRRARLPGPGSGTAGTLPLDRRASFHGTHVAGIAAGDANTTRRAGRDHPVVTGLSGVAPRAWLGNYRVFNVPLPLIGGDSAETPEIVGRLRGRRRRTA